MNNILKSINSIKNNIFYSLDIIYKSSKSLFIYKLLLTLILSCIPYAGLFIWKEILNILSIGILKEGFFHNKITWIVTLVLIYILVLLSENILNNISKFVDRKYGDVIEVFVDTILIDKLAAAKIEFFDTPSLNNKAEQIKYVSGAIENTFLRVFELLMGIFKIIIGCISMFSLNSWIALLVILLTIPSIVTEFKFAVKEYDLERSQDSCTRKMHYLKGLFFDRNALDIKVDNLYNFISNKYTNISLGVFKSRNLLFIKGSVFKFICNLISYLSDLVLLIVSVFKYLSGKIGLGDIQLYLSILSDLKYTIMNISISTKGLMLDSLDITAMREFMNLSVEWEIGGDLRPSDNPEISFNNVSFKYPETNKYILNECSFTIKSGEKFGLVGLNGSGKSTIIKILLGFYKPTQGQVLIDGISIEKYNLVYLRKIFSVVFQDYFEYSMSLRENIALSDIERKFNDSEIKEACDLSEVSDFLNHWEQGLETPLTYEFSENGKVVSSGQCQRIALARAFFRNSPIIILDEPSAALDPKAEHEIFEKFSMISSQKSTLLVSHRLSNITMVDKILMLEDGKIIEQGTHSELLNRNGRYAYLFNLQGSKYV